MSPSQSTPLIPPLGPRDLLWRALSLGVLEREDLAEIEAPPAPGSLALLVGAGRLGWKAAEALEALARARPRLAPRASSSGFGAEISLGGASSEEGGTLGGERGFGAQISLGEAALGKGELVGSSPRLEAATLAGERGADAAVALLGAGEAGSFAASLSGTGTLEGERVVGRVASLTRDDEAGGAGRTVDAEWGQEGVASLSAGRATPDFGLMVSSEDEGDLLEIAILEDLHQQALLDARFIRTALAMGKITWEQARGAWDAEAAGSEWLALAGHLDPAQGMEIFAEAQSLPSVCPLTLEILRASRCGTLVVDARGSGIEGFPGAGRIFAGHELLDRVGEGGMGVVFRAQQLKLNRVVALKVMRGGTLASDERKRRFLAEAEASAALTHPSIVPVHEINEVNGYPFYTMDYIEGLPLDAHAKEQGSSPQEVARLMKELSEGVQHFHQHGIIHRDLKPENVLVSADGPRIIDFGIAKRLGDEGGSGTVDGALVGTPQYMAPEQAAGRVREVDVRTDVYALGVITYELLTGSVPFSGTNAAVVFAIQQEDAVPVRSKRPDVDRDLAAITEMAMAKEPERRYQSAAELAEDLARYLGDLPVMARPATLRYRLKKAVRRNFAAVVAGAVCLAALSATSGYFVQRIVTRRHRVASLIQQSDAEGLPEKEREDLLTQALALEPEHQAALTKRQALRALSENAKRIAEQEAALRDQEIRLEAQRAERRTEQARAELVRERAEREAETLKERERARVDAERQARSAAESRARDLLAKSRSEEDHPLTAIGVASDALVLLPLGPTPLRRELEERKLELALRLCDTALKREEVGMARFWLREGNKLGIASVLSSVKAQVAERTQRLERLLSGEGHFQEARRLGREGRWLEARERLAQARSQGLRAEALAAEERVIAARCRQRAVELVSDGRKALADGAQEQALAHARRALTFRPDSTPAKALVDEAERQLADRVQREAARLFLEPESRPKALSQLERVERLLRGERAATLGAERRARTTLLGAEGQELVYLPRLGESALGSVYIQRFEVTNQAFARFVAAGGYRDGTLWRGGAELKRVRARGAPLTWREGSYGEASNARRPVRGLSVREAEAYARWLSRETGARWRLPRLAEWELAAGWDPQSDQRRTYPWGAKLGAWAKERSQQPQAVGLDARDRSALGVAGLGGGVMEWVQGPAGPATKGACWGAPRHLAERYARVQVSGAPSPAPPRELAAWIGFRLIREVAK